ncbi:ribosome-associated translation inhibitor RaiA [Acetobacterium fimetarium]|uniref:Ribosome hibernation promoting factor n=1 Tax=Acetobacterium fimetarium TaxID=52691 RepID=A0ABR6WTS7_9FIRM|nr:ribosome-associated translation inhibitor RaiA [Acetobacterium fimetarium]MBC3803785.1 ribosome-associated translation inhibitor RaiA [Acetobacterium fimetarium]
MRFTIYGKNMHVSEGLKETLKKKFEKFDRYFEKETEVFATFSKENNNQIKNNQMLEVTIPVGKTILRAEERSEDMVTSIENAVNKLEGQLRKHKTKLERRNQDEVVKVHFEEIEDIDEENAFQAKVVRTKKFAVKPMTVDEATLQMELLGHDFFVFLNGETDDVNVVYMRKDGNYGLIEPTF